MAIEHFDAALIREHFGVSKLPRPLPPVRSDEFYPRENLGSGKGSPVLVTMDLDADGVVERVEAIVPPGARVGVKVRAVLVGENGEEKRSFEPARELDPLFGRAAETMVREMRFTPAELDGQPVLFRGMRMTIVFSDPQSQTA
jgi:hypothetical protein